ncbi:hypothetical protein K439DRAFT_1415620 [Ramaria rubella]|nr:hypothetical protein K439DRAFT_1415620 [Ramaria rubella]
MAKGKNLNPADAQRKAERKKELKKNKTERQKTRDFALVKKDTSSLEEEIERLEKAGARLITASQKSQLSAGRAELARINKKKEEYVAEHPEHRKLVYRGRHKKTDQDVQGMEGEGKRKERKVFNKHGIPRHPERSVYYDPVMNPFGVPPPGMPYMERPLRPDESDSQADEDSNDGKDGSDDDIVMPSGPPPAKTAQEDLEVESDDDIPMPEGPPPSDLPLLSPPPLLPPGSSRHQTQRHPHPLNNLPLPTGFLTTQPIGFPPFFPNSFPPPPVGFPAPQPPPVFAPHLPGWPSYIPRSRPQSNGSIQDPLASAPHQTFQAYRAQQAHSGHPLPDKPTQDTSSQGRVDAVSSTDNGTISAPAQLRDLKKESTAFVPSSLKRKKPVGAMASSAVVANRINAAPASRDDGINRSGEVEVARPDLLGALKSNFPGHSLERDDVAARKRKLDISESKKGKDDYEKFMDEVGDILGS